MAQNALGMSGKEKRPDDRTLPARLTAQQESHGLVGEGRKAQAVRQQVWTQSVALGSGGNDRVMATGLVAKEVDAPAGVEPIEWRLLTNREAPAYND